MKKFKLIALLTVLSISPMFARWDQIGNTCQKRLNFFGLVEVWSGSVTYAEYDAFGNATGNTRTELCTSDGNWDWAW